MVIAQPPMQNYVLVQQPTALGQGAVYPPSYDTTFGAPAAMPVTGNPGGADYKYSYQPGYGAGHPLTTGAWDKNVQVQDPSLSYGQKPEVPAP